MQKRARRPQGIRTQKISVSITSDDLRLLARRREQALVKLLAALDGEPSTEAELQRLRDEVASAPTRQRKRLPAARCPRPRASTRW